MNNQLGRFKVWDRLEKKILAGSYALSDCESIASLDRIDQDVEGLYLHAIGRRDRYVVIPEIPRKDKAGNQLWVGDVLSNGNDNLWVIQFDLMRGVYCTLVGQKDSMNEIDFLLDTGRKKVGDVFVGIVVNHGENHVAKIQLDPEQFL